MKIAYVHDTGMVSLTVEIYNNVDPEVIAKQWMDSHNESLSFSPYAQREGEILEYHFIDDADVTPELNKENRMYRKAATFLNGKVVYDLDRAKAIHLDVLREMRIPKLKELDWQYQQADEQGNLSKKQEIATLKQTLRDIPQNYDLSSSKTVSELREMIPQELKNQS